jgi:hypothetical protein
MASQRPEATAWRNKIWDTKLSKLHTRVTCSHEQKSRKCIATHSLTFDKQQIWYCDYVMQPWYYVHPIQKHMKANKQNLKQCNLTNVNIYSIVIQWVRVQTNIKAMAFQCPIIQQPNSTPMFTQEMCSNARRVEAIGAPRPITKPNPEGGLRFS